jgi:hypothetical protein
MDRLTRLFLDGASARASDADLGAITTACDGMLGGSAGAAVRVTTTGKLGSSVAFAMNSSVIRANPTTAKKPRAGIAARSPMFRFLGGARPKRIGGFEELGSGVLRLLKPYDAGLIASPNI